MQMLIKEGSHVKIKNHIILRKSCKNKKSHNVKCKKLTAQKGICLLSYGIIIIIVRYNNNNNKRLVILAEHTSDHGKQTNSSTKAKAIVRHNYNNSDSYYPLLYTLLQSSILFSWAGGRVRMSGRGVTDCMWLGEWGDGVGC